MKIKNHLLLLLLMLTNLIACKKDQVVSEFTDTPIIESYLEPNNALNVKISRQVPFSSDVKYSADDINNLTVTIAYNSTSHLLYPIGNGQYADSTIALTAGMHYDLHFTFNNKAVGAYTYVPSKPQNFNESINTIYIQRRDSTTSGQPPIPLPDPVELTWDNPDGSYYLVVIENTETTLDPIRNFGTNAPPTNRFRKQPTNLSGSEITAREFQYYGMHRIVLYHVLPDYASLYDSKGTSSQNLSNPSTSISNGYGIFTGLNADTLFLDVKEP
jgi:hypothetical protein